MESKFDDENISLMNHNRIDFPLYTQLDIFKFLRAYDLQKSCINVSKEWRNIIRRYAGELPKFRDQRDLRAIERLLVGEPEPETNQRRSEAYYQRVECVIRKRNARYFTAAGTVVSVLILVITSSILVLHNLHRDENQSSRTSVLSDEVLAMVALSWTTMFLTRYCVWLFDKFGPGQPYQLILYTLARVILLSIISSVKIPDIAFSKWLIILPLYPFELLFWMYVIAAGSTCITLDDKYRSKEATKIRSSQRHLSVYQKIHCWMYAIFRTLMPPAFSTVLSFLFIHFWHSKGITVPSLIILVAVLSAHKEHSTDVTPPQKNHSMESNCDDENISLMNHNRIDFPLYTQLDIFKFLRAYDLQKSCINVSKEWRNTIRRYAGELPKFRDHKDFRAIERLVVGETVLEANQRLSEAYYQRVECVKRKRNMKYYTAAATVLLIFILSITSSVLVLHNLHRDDEQSSIMPISEQKNAFLTQIVSNEGKSPGQSISDEVLAMVALSWTTLFFTVYCVWLFDENAPRKPYQLILYASNRVILLFVLSFVKIPNIASGLNPNIKWFIVLFLYPFEIFFWIYLTIGGIFDNVRGRFSSKKRTVMYRNVVYRQQQLSFRQKILFWTYAIFRSLTTPIFFTALSLLFIHLWHSKGITVPSLIILVAMLSAQSHSEVDLYYGFRLREKITLAFWIVNVILIVWKVLIIPIAPSLSFTFAPWLFWILFVCFHPVETFYALFLQLKYVYGRVKKNWPIYETVRHYYEFGLV